MKKIKIFAILCAIIMVLSALPFSAVTAAGKYWDGSVAEDFSGGNGTPSAPYVITNGAELALATKVTLGSYFVLGNDIYLNNTTSDTWYENANTKQWVSENFYGFLDGNGYTIYGLCIDPEEVTAAHQRLGLFRTVSGWIKNLNVADARIVGLGYLGGIAGSVNSGEIYNCSFDGTITAYKSSSDINDTEEYGTNIGGIAGYIYGYPEDTGIISGCTNYGTIIGENIYSGGIVGEVEGDCTIENCKNEGNVRGLSHIGGICGSIIGSDFWNENDELEYSFANIINCENNGEIFLSLKSGKYVGGIAGYSKGINVEGCVNNGNLTAYTQTGGIIGFAKDDLNIKNCKNYGEIIGVDYMGGIIGEQRGYSDSTKKFKADVQNCKNYGKITGMNVASYMGSNIGGIAGRSEYGDYSETKNYGDIIGYSHAGGIIGKMMYAGSITNSLNTGNITIKEDCGGGIIGDVYATKEDIFITNVTNKGEVYGRIKVGGIAGSASAYDYPQNTITIKEAQNSGKIQARWSGGGIAGTLHSGYIKDCLNDGLIVARQDENTGIYTPHCGGIIGLCEEEAYIENCVNAGSFECPEHGVMGGIVGYYTTKECSVTLSNCYYSKDFAEFGVALYWENNSKYRFKSETEGAKGVSAEEMKEQAFASFDFENVWYMGAEHPELLNANSILIGDVNNDNTVDKSDYNIVKRYCFGTALLTAAQQVAADVNGDGEIGKEDYLLIKRSCFGTYVID